MPTQGINTLLSLSPLMQKNIAADDYEIIAVENESSEMLPQEKISEIPGNIRYFPRKESGTSPAAAINFGLQKASGSHIGIMIDGARMLTPRIIEHALMAFRACPNALVCVPGYYIGPYEHKSEKANLFSQEDEKKLLETIRWKENPYRLFDQCQLSSANAKGFFQPFMESNCFFTSIENIRRINGAEERFNLPGGGSINMYMLKKLGTLPECSHIFVLPGEGTFHQQHGGVSTIPGEKRNSLVSEFSAQLKEISGEKHFRSFSREPIMLGSTTSHAMKFMRFSSERAQIRFCRLNEKDNKFWPDDLKYQRDTEQNS